MRNDVLKKDDKVFLRLPKEDSDKKRNLRPGIVLSNEDGVCLIQLEEPAPASRKGSTRSCISKRGASSCSSR